MSNRCEPCGLSFFSYIDHVKHQTSTPNHYICDLIGCQQFIFGRAGLTKDQTFAAHYATAHFHCPIRGCGEAFYNRSECPGATALQNHYRLKHWEWYCPFCDKIFESKDSANTHQFEGHPKCQECHQVFRTQAEKYAHNKALHGKTKRTDQQCPRCKYIKADGFECLCDRTRSTEEGRKWDRGSDFEPDGRNPDWGKESNSWGQESRSRSQSHSSEQQQDTTSANTDYYSLLGVPSNASHAAILKAAKKARIAAHPDRCSGRNLSPKELEQVIDHSKAVGLAADVLTDAEKRVRYDAKLRKERREMGTKSPKSTERASHRWQAQSFSQPTPKSAERANHWSQESSFNPFAQPKRPPTPKSRGFAKNQYQGRKDEWSGTRPGPFNFEDSSRKTNSASDPRKEPAPQTNNPSSSNNPFGFPNFFGSKPASAPRPAKEPAPRTNDFSGSNNPFGLPNFFGSNSTAFDPDTPPKPASTPFSKSQSGSAEPFPNYSGFGFASQSSTSNSQFNSQPAPNTPFTSPFANGTTQAQSPFAPSAFQNPFQTNSTHNTTNGWAKADEDVNMTGKADDNNGWAADDDDDMMDTI